MCRRPAQKGAGRRSTRALPGRLLNQDPSQDRSRRLSDRLRQAEVLRKSPLQSAGANRTNDRQDQALQTYRATLREDGNKLCLIPRTRLRIHLDQIRPHGLVDENDKDGSIKRDEFGRVRKKQRGESLLYKEFGVRVSPGQFRKL